MIAYNSIHLQFVFDALFIHLIACPYMSVMKLPLISYSANGLVIDLDVAQKPRSISLYIQAWHNQIWELEFIGFFKGKESYTKTKAFVD
jgi:hypothetical protein